MQSTISMDVYVKEAWKPSLHIIAVTGGSMVYSSYHSLLYQVVSLNSYDLFFFILVTHMK